MDERQLMIGGKMFTPQELGIKETDLLNIMRIENEETKKRGMPMNRIGKSSDGGLTWEVVDTPENYGWPSVSISFIDEYQKF